MRTLKQNNLIKQFARYNSLHTQASVNRGSVNTLKDFDIQLNIIQRKFLEMIRDSFLPKFEFVPDMDLGSNSPDLWNSDEIIVFIDIVLDNGSYKKTDLGWLSDIRLFYIQEKSKSANVVVSKTVYQVGTIVYTTMLAAEFATETTGEQIIAHQLQQWETYDTKLKNKK